MTSMKVEVMKSLEYYLILLLLHLLRRLYNSRFKELCSLQYEEWYKQEQTCLDLDGHFCYYTGKNKTSIVKPHNTYQDQEITFCDFFLNLI